MAGNLDSTITLRVLGKTKQFHLVCLDFRCQSTTTHHKSPSKHIKCIVQHHSVSHNTSQHHKPTDFSFLISSILKSCSLFISSVFCFSNSTISRFRWSSPWQHKHHIYVSQYMYMSPRKECSRWRGAYYNLAYLVLFFPDQV